VLEPSGAWTGPVTATVGFTEASADRGGVAGANADTTDRNGRRRRRGTTREHDRRGVGRAGRVVTDY
jgi:tRNA U34 5-methylaminomethyl-2-thiouridine-forming methyltransferase MnmC